MQIVRTMPPRAQYRSRWRRSIAAALTLPLVAGVVLGTFSPALDGTATAAVPAPASNEAIISVKVAGDRAPDGSATGLAGVRLSLFGEGTATAGGSAPVQGTAGTRHDPSWSWSTCLSDADGDCNFIIPIRAGAPSATGVPEDTRFWVAQDPSDAAPSGYFSNPQLRVGSFGATPEWTWNYRFRTDTELRAGVTYSSTAPMSTPLAADRGFMRNRPDSNAGSEGGMGDNIGRTTGVWTQSRVNPALSPQCGLRVALVTDTSGSLGSAGITAAKDAMSTFVDAFRGTPTVMSLFSFAEVSPGVGATNHPTPLPVSTPAQAAAFKSQYTGWAAGGGTNWGEGLRTAANAGYSYDLVVFLTDGNPTLINSPADGTSAYSSLQDIDAGILSANQLKAAGSRIVAVGVGSAITSASELNLRAISGTTANSDYFRASDFSAAAAVLSDLARANCQGSIEVQKMIVPQGGTIAEATPAPAGWQFEAASLETGKVTINAPTSATTTAGSNGIVNFGLTFTNPFTTGTVQVNETQQPGYQHVPVSGQNAVCTNSETGAGVPVSNVVDAAKPGFAVDSASGAQIQCKIYNTPLPPANLEVEKSSNPVSGTVVTPGTPVTYTLSFANTGGQPAEVDYTDYLENVLDDATWDNGPVVSGGGLTVVRHTSPEDKLSIAGTVAPGQTVTVSYTVIAADDTTGNGLLKNLLGPTTTTPPSECVPGSDPTWLCTENPIKGEFVLSKSSDPKSGTLVSPGDVVTYTVTALGSDGPVNGVTIQDDLTDVLDDAAFVAGSAQLTIGANPPAGVADPTGTSPVLLTAGPINLAPGVPATLSYQVKVNADAWSKTLRNVVTGSSEGGEPPTSCEPCSTTHPTPAKLMIQKIGESSGSEWVPMDGSTWTIRDDDGGAPGAANLGYEVTPVAGETGLFMLEGIAPGTYWLEESTAPVGFNLLAEPVQFVVAADGAITLGQGQGGGVVTAEDADGDGIFLITARDVPALNLPESGGIGWWPFAAGGSALLLTAVATAAGLRRKQTAAA